MVKRNKKVKVVIRPQKRNQKQQELTNLGWALRSLGGLGGAALGGMVGMPGAGTSHGTNLGAMLSRWLGSGDYSIGSNSIVTKLKSSTGIPMMHNNDQNVVVRHREYIAEIRSNTSFTVNDSFEINPGNNRTFPWLSHIATGFQEYRIKGMVWHYVPSSGTAVSGTSPSLGTVMLQTSYRANDSPPTSKMEILNEYFSSEAVPSEAFCHPIECDPKENPFNVQYVRSGDLSSSDNALLYDLGVTHVCTSGQLEADNVLGDLWCTYEIELKKPVVASNVTTRYRSAFLQYTGTIVPADLFNGTLTRVGSIAVTAAGNVITFPKGSAGMWLVVVRVSAITTFSGIDLSGTAALTNATARDITQSGAGYLRTVVSGASASANSGTYMIVVDIADNAQPATITLPTGTIGGGSTTSIILVTPSTSFG
jgi:hypothetical protein